LRDDADTFCADVIEHAGVLLLPGSAYEAGLNAVRVGFGRETMPEALARLETYLDQVPR
jgi:aspartate/methionine/tyrosine aminotransferase